MLEIIINILLLLAGIAIGGFILLVGRKSLWASLGIVSLVAAANLLAVLAASYDSGWELVENGEWVYLLISAGVGLVGLLIGRYLPRVAVVVIGFLAGVDIALWLQDIISYSVKNVDLLSENMAPWLGLLAIVVGGLLGSYLTRRYTDGALILITVIIGTEIIVQVLVLDPSANITAIITLSLALVGVVMQYADYMRGLTKEVDPLNI